MSRIGYDGSSGFDGWIFRGANVGDNMFSAIPVNDTFTMPQAGYVTDFGVYASSNNANCSAEIFILNGGGGPVIIYNDFTLTPGSQSIGGQHWNSYVLPSGYFLPQGTALSVGLWRSPGGSSIFSYKNLSGYQYDMSNDAVGSPPSQGGAYDSSHTLHGGFSIGAYVDFNPAAPIITSDSQNDATPGTTIALFGNAFTGVSAVSLGGVGCAFSVISDTQLNVTIPSGQYYQSTFAVTNAAGTGTSTFAFTTDYAPNIASFSPGNGPVGTPVTINGYLLSTTNAVTFNDVSAVFSIQSDNQITATVPTGAQTGVIAVTSAYGTTTTASFTVNYPPTITNASPSPAPPGTAITLTGTFFVGATAVDFNGVAATSFTVNSQTSITATVPSNAGGGSPIQVTTPYGTATFSGFTATQVYVFDGTTWQITVADEAFDGTAWRNLLGIYAYDGTRWVQIG